MVSGGFGVSCSGTRFRFRTIKKKLREVLNVQGFKSCRASKFRSSVMGQGWGNRNSGVQGRGNLIQEFKAGGNVIQEFRDGENGIQDFRASGETEVRSSGLRAT